MRVMRKPYNTPSFGNSGRKRLELQALWERGDSVLSESEIPTRVDLGTT